jgi:hypothetical protein
MQFTEMKIVVGRTASVSELVFNFILGFLLGYKYWDYSSLINQLLTIRSYLYFLPRVTFQQAYCLVEFSLL